MKLRDGKVEKTGKGVAATILFGHNAGKNFGMKTNEQNLGLDEIDSAKSVNDIIACLLLLKNDMHKYIISDYELK